MSVTERRKALEDAVREDPAATRRVTEFVATVRHDLGNLFGTFTMEAHLLGHVVTLMEKAVDARDLAAVARQISELKMTAENLTEAGDRARAFLTGLAPPSDEDRGLG